LAKLAFFHYWLFYYLYSADHKFLKAIFKNKFAFVNYLFSKIPLKAYTVPIQKVAGENRSLRINWGLIDNVIDYIRSRLYEVATLPTERNVVLHKYDLEEVLRKPPMREAIAEEESKDSPVAQPNCNCKAKQNNQCQKCSFTQAIRK
jgi:hypothetical protein